MANPITWRNVTGPDFSDANALLKSGGDSMTRGLNALQSSVQGIGDERQRVYTQEKTDNTQGLLDQISGISQVNGYSDAANAIRGQLGQYGDQVDTGKINAAIEQRKGSLQSTAVGNNQYNDMLQTRTELPETRRIKSLIANKEFDAADSVLGESSIADPSKLRTAIETARRGEKVYTDGQEVERQDKFVNDSITSVARSISKDTDIQSTVNAVVAENALSGPAATKLLKGVTDKFAANDILLGSQQEQVADMELSGQQFADAYALQRDQTREDEGVQYSRQETQSWLDSPDSSTSIQSIGNASGSTSWMEWDTPEFSWVNAGVEGKANGIKYAKQAVESTINKFTANLTDAEKQDPVMTNLISNGLPNAVIDRAFANTPQEKEGEWDYAAFLKNLSEETDSFILDIAKNNRGKEYDRETAAGIKGAQSQTNRQIKSFMAQARKLNDENRNKK